MLINLAIALVAASVGLVIGLLLALEANLARDVTVPPVAAVGSPVAAPPAAVRDGVPPAAARDGVPPAAARDAAPPAAMSAGEGATPGEAGGTPAAAAASAPPGPPPGPPIVRIEPLARAALIGAAPRAADDPAAAGEAAAAVPPLAPAPTVAAGAVPAGARHLALEVASFAERASAEALAQELAREGLEAAVVRTEGADGRSWFVVTLGRFAEQATARRQAQRLEARLRRPLRPVLVLPDPAADRPVAAPS